MEFCDECGSLLPPESEAGECDQCGATFGTPSQTTAGASPNDQSNDTSSGPTTELETLPTTGAGAVKKSDSMEWLESLGRPTDAELKQAVIEKPSDFTGSTFPADISTIRVTGDPQFIETVAGLFSWMVDMEDYSRRIEINLQKVEDKETGEETGNYALYLSVADRG
jgi:DNA-directed RNA polymerase subunit M/transcription elongation factor TFIIS